MRVLTLTGNLLAETTYTFSTWQAGATQRATAESFQVGGKGINVTRMLKRLGIDSLALLFPGGATGKRCEHWLRERAIPYQPFSTEGETRTGAVVRTAEERETTFLGAENVVDADSIAACARWIDAQPPADLLVVSGSIPGWADARWEPLRDVMQRRARAQTLIIDTYGPPLSWLAKLPVAAIKINRREFAGLIGIDESQATDEKMPDLLETTSHQHSAQTWVITDGPRAVWFVASGGKPRRHDPPVVDEVSSTGSGDVFTAGLIDAHFARRQSLPEAVSFAAGLAAANAAHPGIAAFDLAPFVNKTA